MSPTVKLVHVLNFSPDWPVKYRNQMTGHSYNLPPKTSDKIPCSEYHGDPVPLKVESDEDEEPRAIVEVGDFEFYICHDEQKKNLDIVLNIAVNAARNTEQVDDRDSYIAVARTIKQHSLIEFNYIVELYKCKDVGVVEGILKVQDGAIEESHFNELVEAKTIYLVDKCMTGKPEPRWVADDNTRLGGHWEF
ncbi:hypothetical protein Dda_8084 [Drechslerella dactyloides]|uniref:Uncharacterized protein n=1 Tax=Drechslerella dactyloides TaxID=74499 RepID=A0AAD6NHW9_DREDA|nr:hypothetical protein Dda_8084 [Drechslerella dactyloides]